MTAERAIELLSSGATMPVTPHSAEELNEACRMACDALRRTKLSVKTPLGDIVAEASGGSEYPGIWLSLRQPGEQYEPSLALVEYTSSEADIREPALITRVWGDAMQEEYTDRIVHQGIDEYFKIEEDEKS